MNEEKTLKQAVKQATSSFYQSKKKSKHISRKESRKLKRQEKKTKQVNFRKKKFGDQSGNHIVNDEGNQDTMAKAKKKKKRKRKRKLEEDEDISYEKAAYEAASTKDDLIINQLGKKLRINKKSALPKLFNDDGLDYLLEVCDPILDDKNLSDSDEEYLASKKTSIKKATEKRKKQQADLYGSKDIDISEKLLFDDGGEEFDDLEDNEDDVMSETSDASIGEDDGLNDENEIADDINDDMNDTDESDSDSETNDIDDDRSSPKQKNVSKNRKYIPPALRNLPKSNDNKQDIEKDRLKKQLKGLLNRLGETSLPGIANEIERMYSKNSRNDMNEILYKLICDACVIEATMLDQMLMEHMILVSTLHSSIGVEVGSYFLENLAGKFYDLYEKRDGNKRLRNTVSLLAYLYLFNVVHCGLIYDMVQLFHENFTEQDIELILLIMRACGSEMRRDDPIALKEAIINVQSKAASSEASDRSRVRFMLAVITALKNNNLRKIPQYDPELIDNMKKLLKTLKTGKENLNSGIQLKVSLQDLLEVKEKGRWWIVGSAWTGRGPTQTNTEKPTKLDVAEDLMEESKKLLDVAKQQNMNTNLRKNIFCTIMSSEDYADAFERLLKLNLTEKQVREIIRVVLECCLHEKLYNPFYGHLTDRFCEYSKSNQVTLQYALWDRMKSLPTLPKHSANNLAKYLAHVISTQSISISVLKIVRFGLLDKTSIRFYVKFFNTLLKYPENTVIKRFKRISTQPKLALLREGLKIFMNHFLLPTPDKNTENLLLSNGTDNSKKDTDNSLAYQHRKVLLEKCEAALDGTEYVAL